MFKSDNPSAIRSREMIIDALTDLMKKKKYKDITVTDLVNSAGLGRKTFYRHFQSKADVLEYFFDLMFPEYQNELSDSIQSSNNRAFAIVNAYFEFWRRRFDLLRYLVDNNLMDILLKKLNQSIWTLNYNVLKDISNEEYVKYSVAFYSGGLWNLLYQWAENGGIEPSDQMAKLYIKLAKNRPLQ